MTKDKKIVDKKIIISSALGNILEFYDFTLYGFLVAIISPLFFPSNDPLTSLVMGFGVFAIGFIARPLGGIFFGFIGDRYGRKYALSLTIIGVGIPTACIGLLPTYETLGHISSLLLIFLRIIQGFCAGGEYNGAGIFVVENSSRERRGFTGSLLTSSGSFGAILACLVSFIVLNSNLPHWSWRVPFILGSLICFVGFYLRKNVPENLSDFTTNDDQTNLIKTFRNHFSAMLSSFLIGGCATVPLYIITTFMNSNLMSMKIINSTQMMLMNLIMLLIVTIIIPFIGYFADRLGHQKTMFLALMMSLLFSYPFFIIYENQNIIFIILFQIFMICLNGAFVAPTAAYMNSLFPKQNRYSGIAFSYSLGLSLIGGTAPYVAGSLIKITGSLRSPFICLVYAAVFGLVALYVGNKCKKYD